MQELTPKIRDALEREGLTALLPHRHLDARYGASGSGLYARFPLAPLPQVPARSAFARLLSNGRPLTDAFVDALVDLLLTGAGAGTLRPA